MSRRCLLVGLLSGCALWAGALLNPGYAADDSFAAAEERIREALRSPTTLEFADAPFAEVVKYLSKFHKIEIRLDEQPLEKVGIAPDTPITRRLKGLSLRSALRMILRDLNLTYNIEQGVLVITTPKAAAERLPTRVYSIAELVLPPPPADQANLDRLVKFIASGIAPSSWQSTGGRATAALQGSGEARSLVVRQIAPIHDEIDELWAALKQVAQLKEAVPQAGFGGRFIRSPAERKILESLRMPVDLEFEETPLSDVLEYLKDLLAIEIARDTRGMTDTGVGSELPVTIKLRGVRFDKALTAILKPMDLDYLIDNEVLLIASRDTARKTLYPHLYVIPNLVESGTEPDPTKADALARRITGRVQPSTWVDVGGPGVIVPLRVGRTEVLLIAQTFHAHEEIAAILSAQRALGPR